MRNGGCDSLQIDDYQNGACPDYVFIFLVAVNKPYAKFGDSVRLPDQVLVRDLSGYWVPLKIGLVP